MTLSRTNAASAPVFCLNISANRFDVSKMVKSSEAVPTAASDEGLLRAFAAASSTIFAAAASAIPSFTICCTARRTWAEPEKSASAASSSVKYSGENTCPASIAARTPANASFSGIFAFAVVPMSALPPI